MPLKMLMGSLYSKTSKETRLQKIKNLILSTYGIGVVGISIPFTKNLFESLTPFVLLFSLIAIIYEKHYIDNLTLDKTLIIFSIIAYFLTFFIEVLGVKTGFPFGNYTYLSSLGPKVFDTPIIIGINWLLLIYCSSAIFSFVNNKTLKIVFASLSMVFYDMLLEKVACFMNMWCWEDNRVPLNNYASWFIIALILHTSFVLMRIRFYSKLAVWIFFSQIMFFVCVYIIYFLFYK